MAATLRQVYLAITLLLIGTASQAADLALPTQSQTLALLSAHRFADLDRLYGAIQQQYENHEISDEDLRAAFRTFYATDPALEPHYQAWVRESRKSYVAHLARGIYYKKVGAERRGTKFIAETSDEQLAGMEAANEIAGREFTTSLALDKAPLLTYLHAIDLRSDVGDAAGARQLLDASVAVDPKNFIVREKYMGALQTRWLGSVAQMRSFLKECQAAGLSRAHLDSLEAMVLEDAAWVHQNRGEIDAAVHDYRKAAKLDPASNCLPCGPLTQAADARFDQKNYPEAFKLYTQVLSHDPNSITALDHRAFSALQLNRPKEAAVDLQRAADLNDAYAQDFLGRMYLLGTSIPRDRNKAVELLKRAADQGYAPAKELLPLAMNKNLESLPQPGDPRL